VRAQLESIARQTAPPAELVVCDDRSTDETPEIVRAFAREAAFEVRLSVNHARLGSTRNFEKAMGAARMEFVALSDQDDVWHPGKLARLTEELRRIPEAGFAFSDARIVDRDGHPTGHGLWSAQGFTRTELRSLRGSQALEVLLRHNVVTGATMVFRREALAPALPIPEDWVHDGWIALVLAANGPVVAVAESLVDYRQHERNQIGARKRNILQQIKRTREIARSTYSVGSKQYLEAAERLADVAAPHVRERFAAMALAKSRHLKARSAVAASSVSGRVGHVAREMASGRYHRYSNGWKSAAKDLLGY
jgi:glycosyltransferase involved in cell wall biosynthesis